MGNNWAKLSWEAHFLNDWAHVVKDTKAFDRPFCSTSAIKHYFLALEKKNGLSSFCIHFSFSVFHPNLATACWDGDGVAPAFFFSFLHREARSNWQIEILTKKQKGQKFIVCHHTELAGVWKWFWNTHFDFGVLSVFNAITKEGKKCEESSSHMNPLCQSISCKTWTNNWFV